MAYAFDGKGNVMNPPKFRMISQKKLEEILKPSEFRIIENKAGFVKIKKGYGVGITLTFDAKRRSTLVQPWANRKKVFKEDLVYINEITSLLAR